MYLTVGEVDKYIEENSGIKYLFFASTDENKEVVNKYTKLWNGIKNLIEKVNGRLGGYEKYFRKMKFNLDDNLPLNKILKQWRN